MTITNHYSQRLNSPLRNSRWSWGAYSRDRRRVTLSVWGDMKRWFPEKNSFGYEIMGPTSSSVSKGYDERLQHIASIQNGIPAEMIICTVTPESKNILPRVIKSYPQDRVHSIIELVEVDGAVYAIPGKSRLLK